MAQERLGTKRLVVGAHYGTMDFLAQRLTGVIMVLYTLILLVTYLFTPEMTYEGWRHLFAFKWGGLPTGQLLVTLFFLALAWHAWIGVRDIWMDYIKSTGLRIALQALTVLWLVASVIYFIQIIWSL